VLTHGTKQEGFPQLGKNGVLLVAVFGVFAHLQERWVMAALATE
jgi:hypothetical protein